MKIEKIKQISNRIALKYYVNKDSIVKVIEEQLEDDSSKVFFYNVNNIKENTLYYSNEHITKIFKADGEISISIFNLVKEEEENNDEILFYEEFSIDGEVLEFEPMEIPTEPNEVDLLLEIDSLKKQIVESKKEAEKAQLEIIELMMGLV